MKKHTHTHNPHKKMIVRMIMHKWWKQKNKLAKWIVYLLTFLKFLTPPFGLSALKWHFKFEKCLKIDSSPIPMHKLIQHPIYTSMAYVVGTSVNPLQNRESQHVNIVLQCMYRFFEHPNIKGNHAWIEAFKCHHVLNWFFLPKPGF
jgi:hypothetical protein